MKAKRILITGGAGFIGSHLAEKLLQDKHRVCILDNLSTGRLKNIRHLLKNPNLIFKRGSVLNPKDLVPLIQKSDQVYHLAAAVGVKLVVEHPLESFIINTEGTYNVLESAVSRKIPVLIASSSEVYGKNENLPFKEDDDRVYGSVYNERWGYALSKASDEFVGLSYWREKKSPVVIARLFNTVGPRQSSRYGMVIPKFIEQALSGRPITVHGDGKQVRSFSYVQDVVTGLVRLLNTPKAYGEIVNLGSPEPITINNLALKIKKLTSSSSPITHLSYEKVYGVTFEDMRMRVPNINKARRLIGYKSQYSLDEILRNTVSHYRNEK